MANKTYKSTHSGEEIDAAIDRMNSLDMNNYYDKQEIDNKLSQKIDTDKVGESYYNKVEVDEQTHFEDDAKPSQVSVGNMKAGTELAGLSLKTILKMMVYGETAKPEFTNPSFEIEIDGVLFGVGGGEYSFEGTVKFDRGSINPAYETNGYRSGVPYRYDIGGLQIDGNELEYSFKYDIDKLAAGTNEVICAVYYEAGEQPTDSAGAPYSSPYPAGIMRKTVNIIGLTASFSGINNGEIVEDDFSNTLILLDSKNYEQAGLFGNDFVSGYQIITPNITSPDDEQIVLLPDNIEISGIKSWDILAGDWNWYYGNNAEETLSANTWIKTDEIMSKDIDGVSVNYRKYKYNVEDYGSMGKNYFRFFIKEVK